MKMKLGVWIFCVLLIGMMWLINAHRFIWGLAVDPTPPSTVYASTFGKGVFVSYDGGQTWN